MYMYLPALYWILFDWSIRVWSMLGGTVYYYKHLGGAGAASPALGYASGIVHSYIC